MQPALLPKASRASTQSPTPVVDGDVDLGLDQGPGLVRPNDFPLRKFAADLKAGVAHPLAAARSPFECFAGPDQEQSVISGT